MIKTPSRLQQLIEPVVTAMGYELIGLEYVSQGRRHLLRLYIDSAAGVNLDDCGRVSHQVSGILEVEDPIHGPYTLEVSSPGLDRPLFGMRDFVRFVGHKIQVRLALPMHSTEDACNHGAASIAGRRKVTGLLKGVQDTHLVVEEQGQELLLPLGRIEKANLIPEF